jgi:molybdate transport system substrate-binding protein
MKRGLAISTAVIVATLLCGDHLAAGGQRSGEPGSEADGGALTVFAAASLTDLVSETAELFQEQHGIEIAVSPASSGTLARQIELGAEADIYLSASREWVDHLVARNLVREFQPFLANRLVVVVPADSPVAPFRIAPDETLPDWLSGVVVIADPDHAPAGRYAREALLHYQWYDAISDSMIRALNVRAALRVVELGEADAGIVYTTDAARSDRVKVVARFPEDAHTPVVYYCVVLRGARPEARLLYDFLVSDQESRALYEGYGFDLY